MQLQQTVFLDVKVVGYLLSFVRRGDDHVASLYRLRNHGVGQIKDAADNGLIQPLGNAIWIGILRKDRGTQVRANGYLLHTQLNFRKKGTNML